MKGMGYNMNKIYLFLLIFLNPFQLFSQEVEILLISSVSYKIEGESWVDEIPLNTRMELNEKTKRIQIYTKEIQIIDYVGFEPLSSDVAIFGSLATDSNYNKIYIRFLIQEEDAYFIIDYSDISIKYRLIPKSNQ